MAPKTTTVRINLLRTSTAEAMTYILKAITDMKYLPACPKIEPLNLLPEIILIRNIDEILISTCPLQCKEVIVDTSCAAAVLRGSHIYGPGVLAMQSNTKFGEIVNVFADIEGRCKRGANVRYESSQKYFIGIGQVKMQRFQLFGGNICSKGIAIEMHETISSVPSIGCDYLKDGFGLLQVWFII